MALMANRWPFVQDLLERRVTEPIHQVDVEVTSDVGKVFRRKRTFPMLAKVEALIIGKLRGNTLRA